MLSGKCLLLQTFRIVKPYPRLFYCTQTEYVTNDITGEDEFRVLELYPAKKVEKSLPKRRDLRSLQPREKRMPITQDWKSVWPTARSFQPSSVPLPVFQGYRQKGSPPYKYANAELMKIPNFLHLTPPAIKAHCAVLKQFCTKWPEGLETDEDCDTHFPVEVITSDYCHSSPTVRDERARIVTMKIKLSTLKFDYHARDKFIRLVGNHYDKKTDVVTFVADRCPMRKQNYDYLIYVLTALYHESLKTEPWESGKTEADMEKFFFEGSRNKAVAVKIVKQLKEAAGQEECSEEDIKESAEIENYGNALCSILNEEESSQNIQQYKENVSKLLGLKVNYSAS